MFISATNYNFKNIFNTVILSETIEFNKRAKNSVFKGSIYLFYNERIIIKS